MLVKVSCHLVQVVVFSWLEILWVFVNSFDGFVLVVLWILDFCSDLLVLWNIANKETQYLTDLVSEGQLAKLIVWFTLYCWYSQILGGYQTSDARWSIQDCGQFWIGFIFLLFVWLFLY